jgi:hypothetical protein
MFANTDVRRSALKVIDGLKGLLVLEGLREQARLVERGWGFLLTIADE